MTECRPFVRSRIGLSRALTGLVAVAFAAGCAVGPDYVEPEIQTPDIWQSSLVEGFQIGESAFQTWWTEFSDPTLTSLIERATEGSLDLRLALARIDESAARRGISRGEWFPSVDSAVEYQRTRTSKGTNPTGIPGGSRTDDFYSAGVSASWEIDFFGRIRRSVESASTAFEASIEDYRDVLVVLYAEIGTSYVNVRTLQNRITYTQRNIDSQRETLEVVRARNGAGLVPALDVRQAEENLGSTESTLPRLRQQLVQEINSLSVLLGLPPSALHVELSNSAPIPKLEQKQILTGLPHDLLRQRPDVRAAERQLASQTAQIGVATADLYPRFSLIGTFSVSATDFANWGEWASRGFSFGPAVSWNIFNGGSIRSNIRVQDALTAQALTTYEQTVLESLEDVESSMIAFIEEQKRRDALGRSAKAAEEAVGFVNTLYRTGLTDFQNVLDTERSLFERQDQYAESRGIVSQNAIAVYRALGGGWQGETEDTVHLVDGSAEAQPTSRQ
jgi:NodT family efflux transporter outer membrane factor (OMF) lipoprotein